MTRLSHTSTILIVENRDAPREALAALLRPRYRICTADTATAALHIVQKQRVDLIIEDIGHPDRNGIDLLRELQSFQNTKIIVMRGAGTLQSAHDAIALGAVAYLLKPFNAEELLVLVQDTLAGRLTCHIAPACLVRACIQPSPPLQSLSHAVS